MTKYFIFRTSFSRGRRITKNNEINLSTSKNRAKVNIGDRFLLYVIGKNILVTGFSIKEVEDVKPFVSRISLLPSLISNFRPEDQSFNVRNSIIEISEERYTDLKHQMEEHKVSSYEDLGGKAQAKGARFEKEIFSFYDEMFRPLSESSEVKWKEQYMGKYETEVLIKLNGYDILVDAFTNKNQLRGKVIRFENILSRVDGDQKPFMRFVLFYSGDEDELLKNREDIPDNFIIFGKKAFDYYRWLMDTTVLKEGGRKVTGIPAFHMLGELGVKESNKSFTASPYLRLNDGENILYIFKKKVKDIAPILYVARRERGEKRYYQRLLKKRKILGEEGSIDDYLTPEDDGSNSHTAFLNSIVISPDSIEENEDDKSISMPMKYGSVAILDGQHRVYGAYLNSLKLRKENELYFTAIVDKEKKALQMDKQQEYFMTINKEQTKVDPENIWRSYGELGFYKNKLKGVVSRTAVKLQKEGVLTIRKQSQTEAVVRGLPFAGLCRSIEKFSVKLNLFTVPPSRELGPNATDNLVQNIFMRVQLLVKATRELGEPIAKEFLSNDGMLAILFRLYGEICSQNGKSTNSTVVETYLKALHDFFEEDKELMNRIETSGEGPRNAAANLLAQGINKHLPEGFKSLSVVTAKRNVPLVESIAINLDKLSKTKIKGPNGLNLPVISVTGGAYHFSVALNKPVESPESFYKNVVDTLWKVLHEGGNFPPEFKNEDILKKVDSLRLWENHDIGHGDLNEINKKKDRAEKVVIGYLGEHKMPEQLSFPQLEDLKKRILEDVDHFLSELNDHV